LARLGSNAEKQFSNLAPHIFKVAIHGMVFNAHTNSSSDCGLEKNYNLFSHNGQMYFAGFKGQHIIRVGYPDNIWTMFNLDSEATNYQKIGFIQTNESLENVNSPIGINVMGCYISGKNVTEPLLFKLTNVSKKIV
jgi:hypothetical protein